MQNPAETIACALHKSSRVLAALLQVKIDDILVVDATIQIQISA